MSTIKRDGIFLDVNWFLLIVFSFEAMPDTVSYHVVEWFLELDRHASELDEDPPYSFAVGPSPTLVPQLDRCAAELDADLSRLLSVSLLSPPFGWVSRRIPGPLLLPFPSC